MVLSQVMNPKVSEIENQNQQYINDKTVRQWLSDGGMSADEIEWNQFELKKSRMVEIANDHYQQFAMTDKHAFYKATPLDETNTMSDEGTAHDRSAAPVFTSVLERQRTEFRQTP